MRTLFVTLLLAFALLLLAVAGLAIGKLITGLPRLQRLCGSRPGEKKSDSCGDDPSCPVCGDQAKTKERVTHPSNPE